MIVALVLTKLVAVRFVNTAVRALIKLAKIFVLVELVKVAFWNVAPPETTKLPVVVE